MQIPFDVCLWSEVNRLKSNFEFSSSKFGSLTRGQNLNFRKLFKKKSPFISGCLPSLNPLGMSPAIQKSDQLNARTEKTKSKKSVAKSLTTDFHYISAEKRKNKNNKKTKSVVEIDFTTISTETNRSLPVFFGCEFWKKFWKIFWNRNIFSVLEFRRIWLV